MAPRRRALRDHNDPEPLLAMSRARLREAAEARDFARQGIEAHLRTDAECRIITSPQPSGAESRHE